MLYNEDTNQQDAPQTEIDVSANTAAKNKTGVFSAISKWLTGDHESSPDQNDPHSANTVFNHTHDGVNSQKIRLSSLLDFIESVAKIPTYFPKSFYQQFKLQFFEDKNRLYIYDYVNKRWCFSELNIDEYETSQTTLPNENGANPLLDLGGWQLYVSGYGASISATPFANGALLSTPDGSGHSFQNYLIGYAGFLVWENTKKIRYEVTGVATSVINTARQSWGFYENTNAPGPNPLDPADATDKTTVDPCIMFMQEGTNLYAVCGDGTNNSYIQIPGVTLTTNAVLRFKFLWDPANTKVQFFVDDELKATIDTNVPTVSGFRGLQATFAGRDTAAAANIGFYFTYPKIGLQIN